MLIAAGRCESCDAFLGMQSPTGTRMDGANTVANRVCWRMTWKLVSTLVPGLTAASRDPERTSELVTSLVEEVARLQLPEDRAASRPHSRAMQNLCLTVQLPALA